jgi:hypothetical protein
MKILLHPVIPPKKNMPHGKKSSTTYVVEINRLDHLDDIKKDEFGIWKYSGSPYGYK